MPFMILRALNILTHSTLTTPLIQVLLLLFAEKGNEVQRVQDYAQCHTADITGIYLSSLKINYFIHYTMRPLKYIPFILQLKK